MTTVLPSDWCRYGRLPAIVLSNSLCLVAGVVTPLLPGLAPFLGLRFIMGLAFNTFYTVPYILGEYSDFNFTQKRHWPSLIMITVLEYVSIKKRTLVVNLGLAVALTVSGVYQPWLAKYLGHWKTFNWAIFSQVVAML